VTYCYRHRPPRYGARLTHIAVSLRTIAWRGGRRAELGCTGALLRRAGYRTAGSSAAARIAA